METPGAGPSRPSQLAPPLAPATPKSRRRSWFHFGSSSTAPPPLPPAPGDEIREELELGPMTPRQSRDSTRLAKEVGEEEVLTIDGNLDGDGQRTLTKKKKKRSKGGQSGDVGEGEVVRMMDLRPAPPVPRRPSYSSDTSSQTELGIGTSKNNAFSQRTFSRTASDRREYEPELGLELVKPPPRTSSIPFQPKIDRTPSGSSILDKEQPPLPSERPLPPLPPEPAPSRSRTTTPPTAPTGIYVTPSSPIRDTHDTTTSIGSQADRIHPHTGRSSGERRSNSSDSLQIRSQRSSPIGLGLPRQLVPSDHPPPVPSKRQSVSSPVPSPSHTRSSSPAQKISFVEPRLETEEMERGRSDQTTERRQKVRRARSLSGIFRSADTNPSPVIEQQSRPATPDPKDDQKAGGGVLEWLGVRKTVKRRQSETQLRHPPDLQPQPAADMPIPIPTPRIPSPATRVSTDSRKGKSPHGSFVDIAGLRRGSRESDRDREPSRPSSRNANKAQAPAPAQPTLASSASSTSKLGSLFSRRASKHPEGASPSPPTSLPSQNNLSPRDSGVTSSSSRSSFSLPAFDPVVSPIYPTSGPWMSSPATETEEMLFSPEGSNWGPGIRPWMDGTEHPPPQSQGQRSARSSFSSPPPEAPVNKRQGQGQGQDGRTRSHSDAPQPSAVTIQSPRDKRAQSPSSGVRLATSLHSSPVIPGRPKMGNRANSGNAAIIDRMKTVFARSSSRQRASTLLPDAHVHGSTHGPGSVDEFGSLRSSSEWPSSTQGSSVSGSPHTNHDRLSSDGPDSHTIQGIQDERRRIGEASNRSSIISTSSRPETRSLVSRARPRASTVSVGPTTQAFIPASPTLYPTAATPPRRRPSAIRKLSNTLLGAKPSSSSPKSSSLFPLPPRSSGSVSSGLTASGFTWDDASSAGTTMSPRPSLGSIAAATGPTPNLKQLAARIKDESAEDYVHRISSTIPRNEIAGVLATSNDPFYAEAMRLYMTRFDFTHQPLDVALRQLLMHMSLPKETQQIDRVVEALAVRYEQCEPGLFKDKDNTYIVAFSMMMLHTDAFNKHNKNKMSKVDYVRNTRMEGVSPLVLEAFYDNITFSPFVFIEDDADLTPPSAITNGNGETVSANSTPGSMGPPRSGKVDVYHMIVHQLLHTLRLGLDRQIPSESPFSTMDTSTYDTEALHTAFARATVIHVTLPGKRKTSTGILSSTPTRGAPPTEVVLKITKVGVFSRTDDHGETKKGVNKKWKNCTVILTGSQLLFVKDSLMAGTISDRIAQSQSRSETSAPLLHPVTIPNFKPDEVVSMKDCIAVHDRSYTRPATFRLVMPNSRQYLLAAADEEGMKEWIALINYASTFKTAGVRMRGISMKKEQVVLAGAAAAASHKRDIHVQDHVLAHEDGQDGMDITTPKKAVFGDRSRSSQDATSPMTKSSQESSRLTLGVPEPGPSGVTAGGIEVDDHRADADEGEQLEEVFDVVKAELAAGRGPGQKRPTSSIHDTTSNLNGRTEKSAQASRATAFQSQIDRLTTLRDEITTNLASSLITARNLAILTPFQKPTRERISTQIPPLALSIRNDRLQLAKYSHYLSILQRELEMESQEWATVRHVALQAAAKSLRDPKGVKAVVDDLNQPVQRTDLPKLALPDSNADSMSTSMSPRSPSPSPSPLTGMSPGEWPISMLRTASETGPTTNDGSVAYRPHRQTTTDSVREQRSKPRPRIQRSTSSQLSTHSDTPEPHSHDAPDTGGSTPIFHLSENEDHEQDQDENQEADNRVRRKEDEADVVRGGTVRQKPTNATNANTRQKREREVTAVYIGPTPSSG